MYLLIKATLCNYTLQLAYQQFETVHVPIFSYVSYSTNTQCLRRRLQYIWDSCSLSIMQIYYVVISCQTILIIVTYTVGASDLLPLHTYFIMLEFLYMTLTAVGLLLTLREESTKGYLYQLEFGKNFANILTEWSSHHQLEHSVEVLA